MRPTSVVIRKNRGVEQPKKKGTLEKSGGGRKSKMFMKFWRNRMFEKCDRTFEAILMPTFVFMGPDPLGPLGPLGPEGPLVQLQANFFHCPHL